MAETIERSENTKTETASPEPTKSLYERVMEPATDQNCQVSTARKAEQYALGIAGGTITGPLIGGAATVGFCVSSIGDTLLCAVVGFDKMIIGGAAVGTIVGPFAGGYLAHKSIKDAEAICQLKKDKALKAF